jgi:NAD(P)-dependent dehydrogenase (short-subunit alcohol dehydrogenase family)
MKNYVKDRAIVITGGSSGIGLACAEVLAARGADVVVFARGPEQLARALEEIERKRLSEKQRFLAVQLDVSLRAQAENLLGKTAVDFGSPDILINSAGVSCPQRFEDIPYTKSKNTYLLKMLLFSYKIPGS